MCNTFSGRIWEQTLLTGIHDDVLQCSSPCSLWDRTLLAEMLIVRSYVPYFMLDLGIAYYLPLFKFFPQRDRGAVPRPHGRHMSSGQAVADPEPSLCLEPNARFSRSGDQAPPALGARDRVLESGAWVPCLGSGLSSAPERFPVSVAPGTSAVPSAR